jgi:hypothetical protein
MPKLGLLATNCYYLDQLLKKDIYYRYLLWMFEKISVPSNKGVSCQMTAVERKDQLNRAK